MRAGFGNQYAERVGMHSHRLSVLIVDEEPDVLVLLARMLDANGMRGLLARNGSEAIDLARNSVVPIDLVLTNVLIPPDPDTRNPGSAPELTDRLRELRPDLRAMYMSAWVDSGIIRIELLDRGLQYMSKSSDTRALIETIRAAARPQTARSASAR